MGKLKDRYIRFDWAIKRLLRDKANFAVLEGLLTVLFEDKTQIVEILESEGNQLAETDKFNRVDIKAKNSKGEIILVEVQNTREVYYLERILYGVAKTITEHISLGESYGTSRRCTPSASSISIWARVMITSTTDRTVLSACTLPMNCKSRPGRRMPSCPSTQERFSRNITSYA